MLDPINFTTARSKDRIISEVRSARVTIPVSTTLLAGECFYVAPYLGVVTEDVTNDGETTKEVAMMLGPLVVATTKLTAQQTFGAGTKVYWNTSTKKFTETPTDIPAGWVYKAKGNEATPVAHIYLLPPHIVPTDLTDTSLVVEGLKAADLTLLAGLEEQANIADITDTGKSAVDAVTGADVPAVLTDLNKTGGVKDVLNSVLAKIDGTDGINEKLNAILGLLEDLGLMAASA